MKPLALFLLMLPQGTPCPVAEADYPALRSALIEVSTDLEILDQRERVYLPSEWWRDQEGLQADLDQLRARYQKFKDAPTMGDIGLLPDRDVALSYCLLNRTYRRYVDGPVRTMNPDRWGLVEQTVKETDKLYRIWNAARDASTTYYYVTIRREALMVLREELGVDYYRMIFPPPVPVWRFDYEE